MTTPPRVSPVPRSSCNSIHSVWFVNICNDIVMGLLYMLMRDDLNEGATCVIKAFTDTFWLLNLTNGPFHPLLFNNYTSIYRGCL